MGTHRRSIDVRVVNNLLGTESIPYPSYATPGSAAIDLRACIEKPFTLEPNNRHVFATGLAIDIRDPGLAAIIASRSGLSLKHGIRVAQGIGVIDSDYHGELGVILINDSSEPYTINPGERVAQLMFMPVVQVEFHYVDEFRNETERGEGGFGSTGKS
jgi:dUTP pyrophosphatase